MLSPMQTLFAPVSPVRASPTRGERTVTWWICGKVVWEKCYVTDHGNNFACFDAIVSKRKEAYEVSAKLKLDRGVNDRVFPSTFFQLTLPVYSRNNHFCNWTTIFIESWIKENQRIFISFCITLDWISTVAVK